MNSPKPARQTNSALPMGSRRAAPAAVRRPWPEPPSPPPAPPVQFAVTHRAPQQGRLGRDLIDSVTLTNVSGHAITFDSCPGYSESLTRIASLERHQLNCGRRARTFGAGQSRMFAMRLLLPATAAADVTTAPCRG